jgi:hypothetical protein
MDACSQTREKSQVLPAKQEQKEKEETMTEFDKVLETIPLFIRNCPVFFDWVNYKGEDVFAVLNYERSVKAGRPMIDISYCATRAMNNCVLKTVQYTEKYFKPSRLAITTAPGGQNHGHAEPEKA